ncbi:MAG TPA: BON domain-containing protein [Blastocatellia bacterium]|nr:BON domain-containing protein [Blastocatellia bacterium]
MKKMIAAMILALVALTTSVTPLTATPRPEAPMADKTLKQIRKELVTLPFYSVFDNLAFKYEDGTVTLYGQVSRPTLKTDAQRVVERVAGVEEVVNQIEVLPLSRFDDQIRRATFRAIYRQPGLDRLALQSVPPIHIIVNRGRVTLEGVVPTKADSTRAFLAANGVSNVFKVTNNLRIEKQ